MRRVSPAASCRALKTGMATMVVQFGLATMPLGMEASAVGVGLGDDERHVGIHAPGRRVVDDDGAGGGQAGGQRRETEAGAEHRARSMPERSAVSGVLDDDVLVAPGQRRAGRPARGQVPHLIDGEGALGQDGAQDHPHLPGGSDDGDSHAPSLRETEMALVHTSGRPCGATRRRRRMYAVATPKTTMAAAPNMSVSGASGVAAGGRAVSVTVRMLRYRAGSVAPTVYCAGIRPQHGPGVARWAWGAGSRRTPWSGCRWRSGPRSARRPGPSSRH